MARVAACFEDKPNVEAILASLEALSQAGKEADQEWAAGVVTSLNKCSPTSLKVEKWSPSPKPNPRLNLNPKPYPNPNPKPILNPKPHPKSR